MNTTRRSEEEKRKEMARYPLLRGEQTQVGNRVVVIRRFFYGHVSEWHFLGGMLVQVGILRKNGEYGVFYTN